MISKMVDPEGMLLLVLVRFKWARIAPQVM